MAKSSIHIASGNLGYFFHNDRSKKTKNSIFVFEKNEYSHSANIAMRMYRQELQKRAEAYTARTNQKLQKKAITQLSAIVNLNENHTMTDMQPLLDYIEKSLDTKVLQVAIHRDEGHIDEDTKEKIKNYHAHIEMMGLDSAGASVRKKLTKKYLSELQNKTAELLKMERGTNYAKEKKKRPKRLDTYDYKREAEKIAKEKRATIAQVKAQLKAEKQALINSQKATQTDYTNLRKKYKRLEDLARKKELTISELQTELASKNKKKPLLEKIGFSSSTKKDEEIEKLQKINKKLKSRLKQAEAKIEAIEKQKPEIIEYIQNLKAQIESLEQQKQKEKIVEVPKIEYVENPVNIELKRKIRELEQKLNEHKKENEISTKHSFQHLIFFKQYKALITTDLSSYFVKSQGEKTVFKSQKKRVEVVDNGDRLLAKNTNIEEQVKLMLDIAKAKRWNLKTLQINGSDQFQKEAKKQIAERLEIAEQFALFDEPEPEAKPEPKEPESKPQPKPESKEPESKPQPKPESKEPEKPKETKPEPEPKPKPKPPQRTYMHP